MQQVMQATLRHPRRAQISRGLFFRNTNGGVVHIVRRLGVGGLETVCGRRFELKRWEMRYGGRHARLPKRYRACKLCVAAIQRSLEQFRRGEL